MATSQVGSSHKLLQKLAQTGWQSWTITPASLLKFPLYNYQPQDKQTNFQINYSLHPWRKKPAYGWCSWYHYGPDIDETKILAQAGWISQNAKLQKLPLEYILIDDGWTMWGDWLNEDRQKFPTGLKKTIHNINQLGLKTGIWLAPFLVDPQSKLAEAHPDWLVTKHGRLVEGLNLTPWDRYLPHHKWLLDIQNPQVQKYLYRTLNYLIKDCGVDLIKLDFLYALFFNPHLSGTQADIFLRNYLSKIKKDYPTVYTIACGCPLIPAVGVIDSMRIGPDTLVISPYLKFLKHPAFSRWHLDKIVLPTLRRRLWTKKIWHVDPDVFMCQKNIGFTHQQLVKFQNIIKSGQGNIFLGDDLTLLPYQRLTKYLQPLFSPQ